MRSDCFYGSIDYWKKEMDLCKKQLDLIVCGASSDISASICTEDTDNYVANFVNICNAVVSANSRYLDAQNAYEEAVKRAEKSGGEINE